MLCSILANGNMNNSSRIYMEHMSHTSFSATSALIILLKIIMSYWSQNTGERRSKALSAGSSTRKICFTAAGHVEDVLHVCTFFSSLAVSLQTTPVSVETPPLRPQSGLRCRTCTFGLWASPCSVTACASFQMTGDLGL